MPVDVDTGPKNRRTLAREARRQELIDATIESISIRGFSATTLATVTKGANVSHGVVNFHFKTKEALYDAVLGYLAQEHYDLWHADMQKAAPDPAKQLAAIIETDFTRQIASPKKLAVWFAFWGQAMYRPNYIDIHSEYDLQRSAEMQRLCGEIIQGGEYQGLEAESTARRIITNIDGLWLNMLLYPKHVKRKQARNDCFTFLSELFPKHFAKPSD